MVPELSFITVNSLVKSHEPYPVDFDYFWQWCGYSDKGKAKRNLVRNFNETIDFVVFAHMGKNPLGGRPTDQIKLTVNCAKKMAMMARTVKGDEVREYFLRCELVKDYALSGAMNETVLNLLERVETLETRLASIGERVMASPVTVSKPALPALQVAQAPYIPPQPVTPPVGLPTLSSHALLVWGWLQNHAKPNLCIRRARLREAIRRAIPHVWGMDRAVMELLNYGLLRAVGIITTQKPEAYALTEFGASLLTPQFSA